MGIYFNTADFTFSVTLGCNRIKTTITGLSGEASSWIDEILRLHSPFNKVIVGLDIESCLHRKHGESRENLAALLQLCIYFVGAGIFDDVKKLELETSTKTGQPCIEQWGLQELLLEFTGDRLEKPMRIVQSDWGKQYLNLEQVEYAAIDAIASLAVGRNLLHIETSTSGYQHRIKTFNHNKGPREKHIYNPRPRSTQSHILSSNYISILH
ncbi:3'-5' exonuclease domain-containing protein [Rhynchospora pubera]|uniref:3'-5' exonuclease domain-containing protein n=1 Tax=Rhynchospora pubera TaxID=906938 RepID=A0AAV8GM58_9POAL|nr:3'-5' exonuclease domain-containing protein [Rhynchospora pubera]